MAGLVLASESLKTGSSDAATGSIPEMMVSTQR